MAETKEAVFQSVHPGSTYVFTDGIAGFFNDGPEKNQLKVTSESYIEQLRKLPAAANIVEVKKEKLVVAPPPAAPPAPPAK